MLGEISFERTRILYCILQTGVSSESMYLLIINPSQLLIINLSSHNVHLFLLHIDSHRRHSLNSTHLLKTH